MRQTDRSTQALLFAIALGLWLHLITAWLRPVPVHAGAQESGAPCLGRYQFMGGNTIEQVFDTETGKIYTWMPRDEEKKQDPYVVVRDPVNGVGTTVRLKWVEQGERENEEER